MATIDDWLSPTEAARMLHVHKRTLLTGAGWATLPWAKINARTMRIRRSVLEAFLAEREHRHAA